MAASLVHRLRAIARRLRGGTARPATGALRRTGVRSIRDIPLVFEPLAPGRLGVLLRDALRTGYRGAAPFVTTVSVAGVIGFPLFYLVWSRLFPQPYENLPLRLTGSLVLLPLVLRRHWPQRLQPLLPWYWHAAMGYCLVFIFAYFLLASELSLVWVLSMIASTFLLTFAVSWLWAPLLFLAGAGAAWGAHLWAATSFVPLGEYLQYLIIYGFLLTFGAIVNARLEQYRATQAEFEKHLRRLSEVNARIMRDQNDLLSRFLSNSIVSRLRRHQKQYGLDRAIAMMTRQEQRFCGIMQADIRGFTKRFGLDSEVEVAQLVSSCFREITEIGQDVAVLKPVGDSIFVYCDDENGRESAVCTVFALALLFVASVERINDQLRSLGQAPLNFGIAVHAGEVIYGNLASDTFIDPTVIGLNVNKTARLEELTKHPPVQAVVGANAILCTPDVLPYLDPLLDPDDLQRLHLPALEVALRDFPADRTLYFLPAAAAGRYQETARDHVAAERKNPKLALPPLDRYAHKGFQYYLEMDGMGPNVTWTALIDLHHYPRRDVEAYAAVHLGDLSYRINDNEGGWLIVSTDPAPGEYDELDMERRVLEIIDGLDRRNR